MKKFLSMMIAILFVMAFLFSNTAPAMAVTVVARAPVVVARPSVSAPKVTATKSFHSSAKTSSFKSGSGSKYKLTPKTKKAAVATGVVGAAGAAASSTNADTQSKSKTSSIQSKSTKTSGADSNSATKKAPKVVNYYNVNNHYNANYVSHGYYGDSTLGYIWSAYLLGRVCGVDSTTNAVVVQHHNYGLMVMSWAIVLVVIGIIVAIVVIAMKRHKEDLFWNGGRK